MVLKKTIVWDGVQHEVRGPYSAPMTPRWFVYPPEDERWRGHMARSIDSRMEFLLYFEDLPDTELQDWLALNGACLAARLWVGGRSVDDLVQAFNRTEFDDGEMEILDGWTVWAMDHLGHSADFPYDALRDAIRYFYDHS